MNEISAKRKELEEEAKQDLEMGTKDKAWKIEYIASKNMLDGFNLGVEMARKEFLKALGELHEFFEADMWYAKGAEWKTKKDMLKYLNDHFDVCKQSLEDKKA